MSSPTESTDKSRSSSDRRRSSGGLFNNLMAQKRTTEAYSARRQSIEEQTASKGMLGKMWDSAVRGVAPPADK